MLVDIYHINTLIWKIFQAKLLIHSSAIVYNDSNVLLIIFHTISKFYDVLMIDIYIIGYMAEWF